MVKRPYLIHLYTHTPTYAQNIHTYMETFFKTTNYIQTDIYPFTHPSTCPSIHRCMRTNRHTHTNTHLLGMHFELMKWNVSDMQKNINQKDKMKHIYIYIYIYIITGVNDNIKQQRYTICPPSCDLNAPRGGTMFIIKQVRLHRNIAASSLAADGNVPQRPPA